MAKFETASAIIKICLNKPGLKRVHLSKITGLDKSTISRVINEAIKEDWLEERDGLIYEGKFFKNQFNVSLKMK